MNLAFYLEKVGGGLAVIEICDICKKQASKTDGITVKVSDMNGLDFILDTPIRGKRNYEVRICDRCVNNIKKYCKKNMENSR